MQNVSDRPPLVSKSSQTFFSQAVFPAFGEESQLEVSGYLELRLDFLLSHYLQSKEVKKNPLGNKQNPFNVSSVRLSKTSPQTALSHDLNQFLRSG